MSKDGRREAKERKLRKRQMRKEAKEKRKNNAIDLNKASEEVNEDDEITKQ